MRGVGAGQRSVVGLKFHYFVGCWLKFNYFVGCRLNFLLVVGKSQLIFLSLVGNFFARFVSSQ